jgi:hypothetical protein
MMTKIAFIAALLLAPCQVDGFSLGSETSRKTFFSNVQNGALLIPSLISTTAFVSQPIAANAAATATTKDLINDLVSSQEKMKPIPELLQQGEWDKVRTILKTPPVIQLWNLGESQNTLVKLAKETGDIDLLELKDELAISLQMCDQLTYDNAFVYFQPGNGKVKIKEPTELALKAISQINDAISIAEGS